VIINKIVFKQQIIIGFSIICIILILPQSVFSLNNSKPDWINGKIKSFSGEYDYFFGSAPKDSANAYNLAILAAFVAASSSNDNELSTKMRRVIEENGIEGIKRKGYIDTKMKRKISKFKRAFIYDHFSDKDDWYILLCIPLSESTPIPPIEPKYGFKPIIMSAVIPGLGQFHKQQKLKGVSFLLGEVLLLTSSYSFLAKSKDYDDKSKNPYQSVELMEFYHDKSKNYFNYSKWSFIGALVVYSLNLFDASFSEGKELYASKKIEIMTDFNSIELSYNF